MFRAHSASRLLLALALALLLPAAANAQLNPNSYTSLGTLNVTSGTLTINTDTLAMSGAATFTGVAQNQNNGPQIAVFDFSGITIGSGVTVSITGTRAIAFLSQGAATIGATIRVNASFGPTAGPGGYNGATAGAGSANGFGPGSGSAISFSGNQSASGGGYGGAGGSAGTLNGGLNYGNLATTLVGGSGGGGAASGQIYSGAGGGAIEIIGIGDVSVGSIGASGGVFYNQSGTYAAGGGAGGGILLAGNNLTFSSLTVNGGNGGTGGASGVNAGGGGGGRIQISLPSYTLGQTVYNVSMSGGFAAGGGSAGLSGILTSDALVNTIPTGFNVILNSTPVTSIAGSVEAYIRKDLVIDSGATATLGMNNALQHLDSSGNNITALTLGGTFNMAGHYCPVNAFVS